MKWNKAATYLQYIDTHTASFLTKSITRAATPTYNPINSNKQLRFPPTPTLCESNKYSNDTKTI